MVRFAGMFFKRMGYKASAVSATIVMVEAEPILTVCGEESSGGYTIGMEDD